MEINGTNVVKAMEGTRQVREVQTIVGDSRNISKSSSGGKSENYTKEDVDKAVDKINKVIEDEGVYAEYSVHDKFNQIMIKIIDKDTKEVVLELPSKKIIDMVAKMCEMVGVLIDKKA
ncbi:MAG: flagellar protein FlaG [Clostridium sp.]|uniref:flagellar protein FlaG n=1 Tax=Clostridium sp. TaxID=1506 RepID=UPI003039356C